MSEPLDQATIARLKLPALPEGWHYEQTASYPQVVHVCRPGWGAMSIHLQSRIIEAGWCIPWRSSRQTVPAGRGWREALVAAAIEQLSAAWS